MKNANIYNLKGLTLDRVVGSSSANELLFVTTCGRTFKMHHIQDCCESVYIESIVGDIEDIIGHPLLEAAEDSSGKDSSAEDESPVGDYAESYTWTFYKLGTIKGHVVIRWYGSSNGYYSESVDFSEITPNGET